MVTPSVSYRRGLYGLVLPIVFLALSIWSFTGVHPGSTTSDGEYTIVIERTADGLKLTCQDGCAWKKTKWECADSDDCRVEVDFKGVGPVSDSE